ncbi:MAG: SDR family oxidoreductase [Chloroflexota bacterium]
MTDRIFITRATGFVGGKMLPYLTENPTTEIYALVRARSDQHLQKRKKRLLAANGLEAEAARIHVLRGDITKPNFGLSEREEEELLERVNAVIHSAASVKFNLNRQEASSQNVTGSQAAVDFAWKLQERGQLNRLDYVSTCYVGGDRRGSFHEHECDEGQGFRNTYEWSKCVAETHLRGEMERGLRATIHRPSIIVGDSRTGHATGFTAFYVPVKVYARGWWRTLPGRADTPVDLVPVDYVAGAMARLREQESSLGECFHLAAGRSAISIDEVADLLARFLDAKPIRYFNPELWRRYIHPLFVPFFSLSRKGRSIRTVIETFLPYFAGNPTFDTTNADLFLDDFRPPSVLEYFESIMSYAVKQDFQ